MRIAVDAVTAGASLDANAGGMRMTLTSLVASMAKIAPDNDYLVFEPDFASLTELDGIPGVRRVRCHKVPRSAGIRVLYQSTIYPVLLRGARPDVLLCTCNVLPPLSPLPAVVVFQSLQYFMHGEAFSMIRRQYLRRAATGAARRATLLIAVSESAKTDLVKWARVDPKRIRVVHHGLSPALTTAKALNARTAKHKPYILAVTTLYRYKNVERLIRAFGLLKEKRQIPHSLRIVGGDADTTAAELMRTAAVLGISGDVEFTGALQHSDIAEEYRHADAFVYPSLYETFGYPPLEAMAAGCPVAASRASSIPEVVDDAAELFDPMDIDDICRALQRVTTDEARRQSLVARGLRRCQSFRWEDSARRTLAALDDAVLLTQGC